MTDLVDFDADTFADELQVLGELCEDRPDYSGRPDLWLSDVLGEYAWRLQRDIFASVMANRRTAVLSCNNSGKTWLAARIAVWWVLTYWREGVRVVTTAPTAAQVRLLLWQEIAAAYDRAKAREVRLPGRLLWSPYPQWKIGNKVVAFGRKPANHEQSAMQGVHAAHVLAIGDEAGGLAGSILEAFTKITTNEGARILLIGNPDDPTSPFSDVVAPGSDWSVFRVDGLRTPNFTREAVAPFPLVRALMEAEGIPFSTEKIPDYIRPLLLHPLWVHEQMVSYCGIRPDAQLRMRWDDLKRHVVKMTRASQVFTAAARGEFPEDGGESLLPLGWINRAMERHDDWLEGDQDRRPAVPPRLEPAGRRIIGIDVATPNGADETVIAPRQGHVNMDLFVYPKADTVDTVQYALMHVDNVPRAVAVVDVIGVGAGVRDMLARESSVSAVGFNASAQSDRRTRDGEYRFANDRAAAWYRFRELLDPAYGSKVCLPNDPTLRKELAAPRWWIRTAKGVGIIHMESKDDIRKRLRHSTDRADAVIQSWWVDGSVPGEDGSMPGQGEIPWSDPERHQAWQGRVEAKDAGVIAYRLGPGDDDEEED